MSKWNASQEQKEAAAGALVVLGGMLYEWGLPLDRAIDGLKRAYELEAAKQIKSCMCSTERDRELCKDKNRCAEVDTFVASTSTGTVDG